MRLDSAHRNFAGLLGASLLAGLLVFCVGIGCVLAVLVVAQLARHGTSALSDGGGTLWPATVFLLVVGAGAVVGLVTLLRQLRGSRRLARRMRAAAAPLPAEVGRAAAQAGLAGRVELVDFAERFSFAYGAVTPRVALSRGLLESASAEELMAVLAHERYHVRSLDPLKVLLARALAAVFFYLPALRSLRERYVMSRELAADRRAVAACGRRPLATVLLKVLREPDWRELASAAAVGGADLIAVRVEQLESGREPALVGPTPATVTATALSALALTALLVTSIASFGGLTAISAATGTSLGALDLAGVVLCAVPWAVGIWLVYRWLSSRARRPLDSTRA